MFKKPLLIAAMAATAATATISTPASADPVLGALLGAGIGAAVGHNISGRDGAWVGGTLGAITGASIGAASGPYYDRGYVGPAYTYGPPAPVYYGATYYAPAPVYYGPPAVVYRTSPVVVRPYYGHQWHERHFRHSY